MATAQEALNQITDGMSIQELRDQMNTVDADPNADKVALYSGGVGEVDLAELYSHNINGQGLFCYPSDSPEHFENFSLKEKSL